MHTPLSLFPDESQTITGVGQALREGQTTCAAVLEHCFHQIDLWDEKVHAWVVVDRAGAMRQARALDGELKAGRCRGALHGIPFGVKDIIDVAGLPTACGFRPWERRVAETDANVVQHLRDAGAVILGKTVTTQFAWIDPPITRNPWDLDHTPGGSSSGSAAAVATGMCLGAVGSQTGGSVTRPATFCGVAAHKWGHRGVHGMKGILPFAPTLDHLGFFTRTVRDLCLIESGNSTPGDREEKPTIIRPRGYFDRRAEPETLAHFEGYLATLAQAGAKIVEIDDAEWDLDGIVGDHRTIMAAEAAAGHESLFRELGSEYAPHIRALVEEGLAIPASRYARARRRLEERRASLSAYFPDNAWAIATPATVGSAPDTSTTGNPCMNSPWSYLGLPVVSYPTGLSESGLPLGIQLACPVKSGMGPTYTAAWIESLPRITRASGGD